MRSDGVVRGYQTIHVGSRPLQVKAKSDSETVYISITIDLTRVLVTAELRCSFYTCDKSYKYDQAYIRHTLRHEVSKDQR